MFQKSSQIINNMKHKCIKCKKYFIKNSNHQIYCSLICYKICKKEKAKLWRHKNKEYIKKYYTKWILINKLHRRKYMKNYSSIKRAIDINLKLSNNLRGRIYKVLKGISKSKSTIQLLGCSIEQLKQHLEKQFKPGMSWSNYGKWHIDHIKPCSSFDLSKFEEQRKCFNYTNLQPLWAKENIIKRDKIKK